MISLLMLMLIGCHVESEVSEPTRLRELTEFSNVAKFTDSVSEDPKITLLEGLPHPVVDTRRFQSERKSKSTVHRRGFDFYSTLISVNEDDANELARLIQSGQGFEKWSGEKFCDGFHPDFTTIWDCGEDVLEIQFCFGCREAKLFYQSSYIRCDITETGDSKLKKILRNYHMVLAARVE